MRTAATRLLSALVLSTALIGTTMTPAVAATLTPTPTPTPTGDACATTAPTATPTGTASATPTPTPTATPMSTASATPTPTPTATPMSTASAVPTSTATATPSPTASEDCASTLALTNATVDPSPTSAVPTLDVVTPTAAPNSTAPTGSPEPTPSETPAPDQAPEEAPLEDAPVGIQQLRAAPPKSVQCYGSSSLNWICNGALQNALPGWNVLNNSEGGMSSAGIATAGGVHQMYLGKNVTIPASGSVQLGIPTGKPYADQKLGRVVMDAQIGGINGKLSTRPDLNDPSQIWVFTRDAAGAAKTVAKNTPIISLDKPLPGVASIFWLGSNNLDDIDRVKDDTARMIKLHQATSSAPFYVVELPPAWGGNDHPLTAYRKNINSWIKQNYGQHVIPLADYLSNGALYDAGLIPSQADRDSIARGVNPRSFWMSANDLTHMNSTGQNVAARYFAKFVRDGNTYSNAIKRFDAQSTANISVNGNKVTVSGHAFDFSDLFASIPVGITVNGAWNATMASGSSTHLFAYGIPGRHSYSMTFDLKPGKHFICTVGVNFGAGKDYFPPCQTVTVKGPAAPIGGVMDAPAANRMHQFAGWTYAPSDPSRSIPVAILVDGKWHHVTLANRDSPYLKGVPGKHAFWTAAAFSKGKHSMCAVAIESNTNMTNLGCKDFTIK